MKNVFKLLGTIVLLAVIGFSMVSCTGGGGKSLNSAEALEAYLDKQPANGPDKPIKVTMAANDQMLPNIVRTISSAGKFVSLNLSGNALTAIPNSAFRECVLLAAITIPDSVTSIGKRAFYKCTSLTSVSIPKSVTSIEEDVFFGCTSLTSVSIPKSVTSICDSAFGECTSLKSVTIPNKRKMTHFTQLQG